MTLRREHGHFCIVTLNKKNSRSPIFFSRFRSFENHVIGSDPRSLDRIGTSLDTSDGTHFRLLPRMRTCVSVMCTPVYSLCWLTTEYVRVYNVQRSLSNFVAQDMIPYIWWRNSLFENLFNYVAMVVTDWSPLSQKIHILDL